MSMSVINIPAVELIMTTTSPGEVCKNCSDGDKSMQICSYVLWTVVIILKKEGN